MASTINALTSGGGVALTGDTSGQLQLQTNNGTTAVTIDTSQNVGIGLTSPTSKLTVRTADGDGVSIQNAAGTAYRWAVNADNSFSCVNTGVAERMRIDSSGNLLVNVSNPANIDGVITSSAPTATRNCLGLRDTGTSYGTSNWYVSFVNSAGASAGAIQHTAATTVSYATSSDKRLKENIVDAPLALDKVMKIPVRSYDWKEDKHHVDYGFIAQELYKIDSEAVGKGDDAEELTNPRGTWQVEYGRLTPMLVKAIQEQQALITQLQADVAALKGVK